MLNLSSFKSVAVATGALFAMLTAGQLVAPSTLAGSSGLDGSWGGRGKIVFPSGETERARCRAHFRSRGGNTYSMNAVCATSSARVEQVARIRRVGGNIYRGDFFNEEHGIAGSIRILLKGGRLIASLTGGGGSAEFLLKR
jgi:hypothetical protein